jgi:hypothetical protein
VTAIVTPLMAATMHSGAPKKDTIDTGRLNNAIPHEEEAPLQGWRLCVGFELAGAPEDEKWVALSSCVFWVGTLQRAFYRASNTPGKYYVGWLHFRCVCAQPNVLFDDVEGPAYIGS